MLEQESKEFILQWQIWKILWTICKTKRNVIISQNIYSNPLNAFLVCCCSTNSSPRSWICITVLFRELYGTQTHRSSAPGIVWMIALQTIQGEWATADKGRTIYLVIENVHEATPKGLCSTTLLILASISSHSQHHVCLSPAICPLVAAFFFFVWALHL